MISRRSPRTRYGMTYRAPGTTSSRVPDSRPGRPRFGSTARRSTAASNVAAVRAAASGFSRAVEARRSARWPIVRGDQTTVTREVPFVHASCPRIGATSTPPRAPRRARYRVGRGQLESHPIAISPLPHRRPDRKPGVRPRFLPAGQWAPRPQVSGTLSMKTAVGPMSSVDVIVFRHWSLSLTVARVDAHT